MFYLFKTLLPYLYRRKTVSKQDKIFFTACIQIFEVICQLLRVYDLHKLILEGSCGGGIFNTELFYVVLQNFVPFVWICLFIVLNLLSIKKKLIIRRYSCRNSPRPFTVPIRESFVVIILVYSDEIFLEIILR